MNKVQACLQLDISSDYDLDDVREAYIDKVFEMKQAFLRTDVVPLLIRSKMKKIKQLNEAITSLDQPMNTVPDNVVDRFPQIREKSLHGFMTKYNIALPQVKYQISQATGIPLLEALQQYLDAQLQYYQFWAQVFSEDVLPSLDVKMTLFPNPMDVYSSCQSLGDQNELSQLDETQLMIIQKEVSRARKIMEKEVVNTTNPSENP